MTYDAGLPTAQREAQVQAARPGAILPDQPDYTDTHSPIDRQNGRTEVNEASCEPGSGILTTIVSKDPMYVNFTRLGAKRLSARAAKQRRGGYNAVVIKIRLTDGRLYDQNWSTGFRQQHHRAKYDTFTLRGVYPIRRCNDPPPPGGSGDATDRGEFVTVLLEGVQPVEVVAITRDARSVGPAGRVTSPHWVGDNKAEQAYPARAVHLHNGLSHSGLARRQGHRRGCKRVPSGQTVAPGRQPNDPVA